MKFTMWDYYKYNYLDSTENAPKKPKKQKEPTYFGRTLGEWFWIIIFGFLILTLTSGTWGELFW